MHSWHWWAVAAIALPSILALAGRVILAMPVQD